MLNGCELRELKPTTSVKQVKAELFWLQLYVTDHVHCPLHSGVPVGTTGLQETQVEHPWTGRRGFSTKSSFYGLYALSGGGGEIRLVWPEFT